MSISLKSVIGMFFSIIILSSCVFTADDEGGSIQCDNESITCAKNGKLSDVEDVANAFTQGVTFAGGTLNKEAPPTGITFGDVNGTPVSLPDPGDVADQTPTAISKGATNNITVPLGSSNIPVGTNITININFGDNPSSFVSIPVNNFPGGDAQIPMSVPDGICDNLADIQHQIKCYESVTLPDGTTITTSNAQAMILQCGDPNNTNKGTFCFFNDEYDLCQADIDSGREAQWVEGQGISSCPALYGPYIAQEDWGNTTTPPFGSCVFNGAY